MEVSLAKFHSQFMPRRYYLSVVGTVRLGAVSKIQPTSDPANVTEKDFKHLPNYTPNDTQSPPHYWLPWNPWSRSY